jgi:3-phosphoshikimate 1-carboxyvinyltransferase
VFFTGDESIRRRPMGRVLGPLESMGATVLGSAGNTQAPFGIRGGKAGGTPAGRGPLVAKAHELKVASAQVKSAILLATPSACSCTSAPPCPRERAPSPCAGR